MSDSPDPEHEPALPVHRAEYQREYRRRRRQNALQMPESSEDEDDLSDDYNHPAEGYTSDEEAMSSEGSQADQGAFEGCDDDFIQPGQEPANDGIVAQVLDEENNDALIDEEGGLGAVIEEDDFVMDPQIHGENEVNISATSSESGESFIGSSEDPGSSSEDIEGQNDEVDDNDRLYNGAPVTVADYLLAVLSFSIRHRLTGQCLNDLLSLIALCCPPNNHCLKTLYKFKKYFSMIGCALVVFHYFCTNCEIPLGNADDACEQCNQNNPSFFLELPLLAQMQKMFSRVGFYKALQFRFVRRKKFMDNIEDVYDGQLYKQQMQNGFLSNPNNMSLLWYSDGIAIYKSTHFSIWPMFLAINELNYKARTNQENIILAGIWFGKKPNPNLFLAPLHSDLNRLHNEGHVFQRAGGGPVRVGAKLLMGVCDLRAKCRFMRFKQWNGFYGCTGCLSRGERYALANGNSVHVYPHSPVIVARANADIPFFAEQAVAARHLGGGDDVDFYGVKGPTLLYNMLPNLILCMGIDVMHGIFLGLMKLLISLWFDAAYAGMPFSIQHLLDIVDDRLSQLKPPSNVQYKECPDP